MKCDYCSKESDQGISLYVQGELVSFFCSVKCNGLFTKKATRIIKKMSREDLLKFIEKNKGVSHEKN